MAFRRSFVVREDPFHDRRGPRRLRPHGPHRVRPFSRDTGPGRGGLWWSAVEMDRGLVAETMRHQLGELRQRGDFRSVPLSSEAASTAGPASAPSRDRAARPERVPDAGSRRVDRGEGYRRTRPGALSRPAVEAAPPVGAGRDARRRQRGPGEPRDRLALGRLLDVPRALTARRRRDRARRHGPFFRGTPPLSADCRGREGRMRGDDPRSGPVTARAVPEFDLFGRIGARRTVAPDKSRHTDTSRRLTLCRVPNALRTAHTGSDRHLDQSMTAR